MAKKQTTPPNHSPNSRTRTVVQQALAPLGDWIPEGALPDFFRNTRVHMLLVAAFAFLLYANTLTHQFVQDDAIVITDNMFTKQGAAGIGGILTKDTFFGFFKVEGKDKLVSGGRYRPFTLVIFALLYSVVGDSPFAFHLLTVLLFAGTCVVLYRTLLALFEKESGRGYATLAALLATVIFAAHPVHTEVVANVKGCDEIVTLLGSLATLWLVLRAFDEKNAKWAWIAAPVFFLACMSKENAITFLAVIPLALWVFRRADAGRIVPLMLPLGLAFLVFFGIRSAVLGVGLGKPPLELMNNPFIKFVGTEWVHCSAPEKLATITYTLGQYIRLLVAPLTLSHDYYPRTIGIMRWSDGGVILSLLGYIALVVLAVRLTARRSAIGFGIWYYLLTLSIVSNIVFPVGTNMGERFLFMPSVGYALIVSVLLLQLLKKNGTWNASALTTPLAIGGVLALAYGLRTVVRNPAWSSNENLFFTDVHNAPNSAKIRNACGGVLFDKARLEKEDAAKRRDYCTQALPHLNKALEIYPNYADAFMSRAGCHVMLGNADQSVADYRTVLRLQPQNAGAKSSLAVALREAGQAAGEKKGDLNAALKLLTEAWSINSTDPITARLLGVANGMGGRHADALTWFNKSVELEPTNASTLFDLGTAYQMAGDNAKAAEMRTKAEQLEPGITAKKTKK
jgi:protein O-mannosyl-transferase